MNKKLIVLGVLSLVAVSVLLYKFHNHTRDVVIGPTRDDVALCQIRQCFHPEYECSQNPNCKQELITFEQEYEKDPTQYNQLVQKVKSSELVEFFQCLKTCQVDTYIEHCGKEDVYIKNCMRSQTCVDQNKAYFDNFKTCTTRQYQACNGLSGEKAIQCRATEIVYCASDGLTDLQGDLAKAFFCV